MERRFDDLVAAALREPGVAGCLDQVVRQATSTRRRQIVAIAAAYLAGDGERVDGLAREHLVDHPDSVIVAQIAAAARRWSAPTSQEGEHS